VIVGKGVASEWWGVGRRIGGEGKGGGSVAVWGGKRRSAGSVKLSLYKILFHFNALL